LTTVALLVALGCTPADAQALTLYTALAGAVYGIDRHELLAITGVESTYGQDKRRSHKGACGVMGVLGGRYGAAPCWAMEAFVWLAVFEGARRLAYFRRYCEGEPLCCYNQGWTTVGECSYARRVRGRAEGLSASDCPDTADSVP
jgi:hypothetical protein|tara:strand:- start:659 stop:1093 length:435 start_codon:yes stop_codon:yes gene_type:complete